MGKARSVKTKFWEDPFIEDLSPNEKLLFLYLLTNPQTNLLGVYEISIKRISYDTGLSEVIIRKGFESFERVKKVFYIHNYVIVPNFLKNQKLNANMKKAVVSEFNTLPESLRIIILKNGSEWLVNDSESFEMIRKGLVTVREVEVEVEVESEVEIEDEIESENEQNSFSEFWDSYHEITGLKKTDMQPAQKYWKQLTKGEKEKALKNIQLYYDSLNDKKYCKKARTYLSAKSYNDEFASKENQYMPIIRTASKEPI